MGVDKIYLLMDAVDEYIPTPDRDIEKTFLMAIEDVFSITGRGTVATGRIERGVIKVGENVEIVGLTTDTTITTITGIEMFQKTLNFILLKTKYEYKLILGLLIKHGSSRLIKIMCLFARIKFKTNLIKY